MTRSIAKHVLWRNRRNKRDLSIKQIEVSQIQTNHQGTRILRRMLLMLYLGRRYLKELRNVLQTRLMKIMMQLVAMFQARLTLSTNPKKRTRSFSQSFLFLRQILPIHDLKNRIIHNLANYLHWEILSKREECSTIATVASVLSKETSLTSQSPAVVVSAKKKRHLSTRKTTRLKWCTIQRSSSLLLKIQPPIIMIWQLSSIWIDAIPSW